MRKLTPCLLTIALLYSAFIAHAQTDSGYTDLGRLKLNTAFTQAITIQGKDLEKIPFSSLEEAINVYLYGGYSKKELLIYVIDGNLVNDVNAYSIYDIETVTLVQNALTNVNGVTNGQRLVLIKTRTRREQPAAFTIAGSSYLVSRRESDKNKSIQSGSSPDLFHQYYISGQARKGRSAFGGSVNWLRKIWPVALEAERVYPDPYHFNRFRFNAWYNALLGKHSELSVNMNAAPQRDKKEYEVLHAFGLPGNESRINGYASSKKLFLNPSVRLFTRFSKGWSNDFSAAYVSGVHSVRQHTLNEVSGTMNQTMKNSRVTDIKERQLIFRDHIRYQHKWKNWLIAPAVNLTFRNTKYNNEQIAIEIRSETGGLPDYTPVSTSGMEESLLSRFLLFTPSVSLGYRDYFSLQGGMQMNTNWVKPTMGQKPPTLYPFITAGADLVKMIKPESGMALKLFGSYAKTANWGEIATGFTTLSISEEPGAAFEYIRMEELNNAWDTGDDWQVGLNFQPLSDRLLVSYNYENKTSKTFALEATPIPGGFFPTTRTFELKAGIHRVGIMANRIAIGGINWRTGINAASMRNRIIKYNGSPVTGSGSSDTKREWTGGWVNHFSYKKITAGFNVLYSLNSQFYQINPTPPSSIIYKSVDVFALQHVYLGYRFFAVGGNWEVYASGRNLLQSDNLPSEIGALRYYGAGVKVDW